MIKNILHIKSKTKVKKVLPKKENKVFLFSDYDQIAIRAMAEADNYGYESSQNYTVKPALDENGELIGYECVFLN